MVILAIETSCDETAAAIVKDGKELLSSIVASQINIHKAHGGVVPEIAARSHIEAIIPTINEALKKANMTFDDIDSFAVTEGPGLIGSLLIGVETAKSLAWSLNKPLIPVNHLTGHIYANWINSKPVIFPALCLIVSGGHTILIRINNHYDMLKIAQTKDDAAGEAFDKIAKLLGLGYPGGPAIAKAAQRGIEDKYILPRAMCSPIDHRNNNLNYSFSGLKTAVSKITKEENLSKTDKYNLAASFQLAAIDSLIKKIEWYLEKNPDINTVMLAGGVSANTKLKDELTKRMHLINFKGDVRRPKLAFSTDNAAMIATAAYYHSKKIKIKNVNAFPSGASNI